MSDPVELLSCPHGCGCLWAETWPYPKCDESRCWCAEQDNPWWHNTADLTLWEEHNSNEAEPLSGSEDETELLPKVEE